MLKVAVVGASGYTGGELLRLLIRHPKVHVTAITSEQSAGKPVCTLFPHLTGQIDLVFEPLDLKVLPGKADFFFLALPHTASMSVAAQLIHQEKKVVDLSADFRLKDSAVYQQWYRVPHQEPELLRSAVYGLPELHRNAIRKASLVANPGCYPTGALLGLAPLGEKTLTHLEGIVIDAKSGISGAGRTAALTYHFPEVNESVSPYHVTSHRHQPEIEQELSTLANQTVQVTFTPHLIPMSRGILTTLYARLKEPVDSLGGTNHFKKYYKDEPFIQVLPPGQWPNTQNVRGSNNCHLSVTADPRTRHLIIITSIDNLMKGASGQAVQNMNLMMGFDETWGLETPSLFP